MKQIPENHVLWSYCMVIQLKHIHFLTILSTLIMLLVTITLVYLTSSIATAMTSNEAGWLSYKGKYGKVYSEDEDGWRKEIWLNNTRDIQIHNAYFAERYYIAFPSLFFRGKF